MAARRNDRRLVRRVKPGDGRIDVRTSEVGMRRAHFVADDGTEHPLPRHLLNEHGGAPMPTAPMPTAPMPQDTAPVLVTGATGKQGGATARALLAAGVPVRALVRDAATDRARALEALGVELITGDLLHRESVVRAATGARAVFSVQMPAYTPEGFDFDGEVTQGTNLIKGAKAAGVRQFVHTSVAGAGQHNLGIPLTTFEQWANEHLDT
jgi:hypothetical protein